MPDENSPPSSPRKRTQGHRRSLSGVWGYSLTEEMSRMGISSSSSATASSSTRPSQTGQKSSWSTLSGGWPNWSSIRRKNAPSQGINFAITMRQRVPDYSMGASTATQDLFNDAAAQIYSIRNLIREASGALEDDLDNILIEHMSMVVFGSNLIERAGRGLDETLHICRAIFRGERSALENIPPRSVEYQARLEKLIGGGPEHQIHGRREVVNHAAAFVHMTNAIVKRDEPFSEELIKETHRILCRGVDAYALGKTIPGSSYGGVYRTVDVRAGNTNFVTPKFVPKNMAEFIEELNSDLANAEAEKKLDPFLIAAKACDTFVNIHPFLDGNGRTCRLILNSILLRYAGIVACIGEHDEERTEYLQIAARRSTEETGPGELAVLTLKKSLASLKNLHKTLTRRKKS